ncbi:hypothetical protein GCM10027039_15160 [Terrabacter koreensis]|jgi:F0F1-type ATP synthase assembly protein I
MTTPTPPDEPTKSSEPSEPSEPTAAEKAEELRAFNSREQDSAWRAVAYLLSGPLVYGGLGALADHWLGTSWLVGAGIVGGMALSLYLIWFRYGTH